MGQIINTNVSSLNAQRNLTKSNDAMSVAIQRLSSGLRINSAKDDAAGLAISTRFTSQINGLNQAVRNANDGISLAQVAEGAMQETTNLLQRMRTLAVQAANGTYSSDDRNSIQDEIDQLSEEIDRIANNTTFNSLNILDGSYGTSGIVFQIGADSGQYLSVTIDNVQASALGIKDLSVSGATKANASAAIKLIDEALDKVTTSRASLGAVQNRLEFTISNLSNVAINLSAANSRIVDTDYAAETAILTKNSILQQAGIAMLAQANSQPQSVLQLLQ